MKDYFPISKDMNEVELKEWLERADLWDLKPFIVHNDVPTTFMHYREYLRLMKIHIDKYQNKGMENDDQ